VTATVAPPGVTSGFHSISASRKAKNGLATVLVWASFLVALVPLVWLLWTVIGKGFHVVAKASWWTQTQRNITYKDPGGGALHAIVGTLEQVALCAAISVPIALLVGVYLVEYGRGPMARATTFMVDILTGIPSIVAALFIFTLLGVAMIRYRYPVSATVVGILLGRMLETQSILTHQISGGSFSYVLQRPAAIVLMAIMALSLVSTALSKRRQSRRAQGENAAALS